MVSTTSDSVESPSSVLGILTKESVPDLPKTLAYHLKHGRPTPCWPNLLRLSIALQTSTGILTCFPSTTLLSLALGVDSPCPRSERRVGKECRSRWWPDD